MTKGTSGTSSSLGRGAADYLSIRNEALLREGMGLGEYTYIYVMAYGERLRALSD